MPKIKSAQKALRVSERNKKYNLKFKEELRALIKKIKKERKKEDLKRVISLLDKAASKNVIHKNKAARLKSRLFRKFKEGKEIKEELKRKKKVLKRRKAD